MTKEFKIKKFKDATVYVLESASSGATGTGAVTSVSSAMGSVRKRGDNLITQEEQKEAPKPRNFVAKNAKMGGAGQHKDKKKAQKQGNEKHKKPFAEADMNRRGFLKGLGAAALAGATGGIATKADAQEINKWTKYATDLAVKTMGRPAQDTGYDLRNWLVNNVSNWVTDYCSRTNSYNAKNVIDYCNQQGVEASGLDKQNALVTAFLTNMKNRYQDFLNAYRAAITEKTQEYNKEARKSQNQKQETGELEGKDFDVLVEALMLYALSKDHASDPSAAFSQIHKDVSASIGRFIRAYNNKEYVNSIFAKLKNVLDTKIRPNKEMYLDEVNRAGRLAPQTIANLDKLSKNKEPEFKESVEQGVAEDHEVQMASNELKSIHANAKRLLTLVQQYGEQGDLEAWQQSKITKAADYLNSVLQSIGGEQDALDVDEDHSTVGGWGKGSYDSYSGTRHGRGVAEAAMAAQAAPGTVKKGGTLNIMNKKVAPPVAKPAPQAAAAPGQPVTPPPPPSKPVPNAPAPTAPPVPGQPVTPPPPPSKPVPNAPAPTAPPVPGQPASPAAPAKPSLGADFEAGLAAQKAGGSPTAMLLAQPSIGGDQRMLDAIASGFGLPKGSTADDILAADAARTAGKAPVAEGMDRAVDNKGRTQQEWVRLVKAKFPNAKIRQSKMIDGPIFAMLPDGRKLSWNKVEQDASEAYGRYDRRDAYQRDYDHSVAGMDRGNDHRDDERHDLDPSDWYIVKDGKMYKVSVYPNQEQEAISRGYSRTRDEAKARAGEQGVAEGDKYFAHLENMLNEDWQKANRRDKTDGMSRKAVKAYRRENPGSKLKTAVTTKPSKLKKGGKAAKRRKSFCARMSGNKGPMKKPNGKPTPKALALRRWNCEEDAYMNSLNQQVLEKLNPQADVDVWVQDFQKADPNKYKQFKNKTPQKKAQMAVAAHYAANEPSKKK